MNPEEAVSVKAERVEMYRDKERADSRWHPIQPGSTLHSGVEIATFIRASSLRGLLEEAGRIIDNEIAECIANGVEPTREIQELPARLARLLEDE